MRTIATGPGTAVAGATIVSNRRLILLPNYVVLRQSPTEHRIDDHSVFMVMASRETILEVLKSESVRRRKLTRQIQIAIGLLVGLYAVVMAIQAIRHKDIDTTSITMICLLAVVGGMAAGATPALKEAAKSALEDPEALPYLIELMDSGDPELVTIIKESMKARLGSISENDAELFEPNQIAALRTYIFGHCKDADFSIIAMGALRKIGGPHDLKVLDYIASGALKSTNPKDNERLKNAALSASADLRLRLARLKISETVDSVSEEFETMSQRLPVESADDIKASQ